MIRNVLPRFYETVCNGQLAHPQPLPCHEGLCSCLIKVAALTVLQNYARINEGCVASPSVHCAELLCASE